MIKEEIVARVSAGTKLSRKSVSRVVDAVLAEIMQALERGEKIQLLGFGTFEVRKRAARTGKNLNTGDPVPIPPRSVPVFKPGVLMKTAAQRSDET